MRTNGLRTLSILALTGVLLASVAVADDNGVLAGSFKWDAEVEVWEPAANPVATIHGQQITREAQKWASVKLSVPFECRVFGDYAYAVNPTPNEGTPQTQENLWGNLHGLTLFAGVELEQPSVELSEPTLRVFPRSPQCFGIEWSFRFKKKGGVFKFTPPVGGGTNPLGAQPFENQLDEDMNDKLKGLTEICCCAWSNDLDEIDRKEAVAGEPESTHRLPPGLGDEDETWQERGCRLDGIDDFVGVDWVATSLQTPNPTHRNDPNTQWKGYHETKVCQYSTVRIQTPSGGFTTKRVKASSDYDSGNEAKDADHQSID